MAETIHSMRDYYRCPESFCEFALSGKLSGDDGFFLFGDRTICFGRSSQGHRGARPGDDLYDVWSDVEIQKEGLLLPFDPSQVIANLRLERYCHPVLRNSHGGPTALLRSVYYSLRPLMPVGVRRHLQKVHFHGWEKIPFPRWPVDRTVEEILEKVLLLAMKARGIDRIPFVWFWPDGAPSCTMVTHDVETGAGMDFCPQLMDLDDRYGIKSSFQVVPEVRYAVSPASLEEMRRRGFEVNVQDLNHDGNLFRDREEFLRRVGRINHYVREFGSSGFRAAVMYRNVDWLEDFEISYDMSIPNVAHLEPQRGGCCTVMPYFIGKILELPLTTTQDYTLFHILNQYDLSLWKQQIDSIREKHGLASFIIHPDYVVQKKAQETYRNLLDHLSQLRSTGETWIALPGEINQWWRKRSGMKLELAGESWRVVGEGNEHARVAFASISGDRIVYTLEETPEPEQTYRRR